MRGQQRNQIGSVQSDSEEDNDNSTSDEEPTQNNKRKPAPSKRGRGRPAKNKRPRISDESDNEMSTNSSTTNSNIVPRRCSSRDVSRTRNMLNSIDISANNTNTNIAGPPSTRRRGRPKKNVEPGPSGINSLRNVQNGLDNDSGEESCASVVADSDDCANNTDSSTETPSNKRRRGRPPKNTRSIIRDDSDNEDDNEVEVDDEDCANNTDSSTETPSNKRRRGRPPKNTRSIIRDDSDNEDDNGKEVDDEVDISTQNVFTRRSLRASTLNRASNTQPQINGHLSPQPGTSSARDTQSPQPGTSSARDTQSSQQNSDIDEYEEPSCSSSESIDSDDPLNDIRDRRKTEKRKGRPKTPSPRKKQKLFNTSANRKSQSLHENSQRKQNGQNKKNQKETLFDAKLVENLAQKLVYFLLIEEQKKYAIKKKAIITHVFKEEVYSTKLYKNVTAKANTILKKTYGMELMEVENLKDSYLIVNILSRELCMNHYIELPLLKKQQYGLILYLLTVIYMNENTITEDELEKALKILKIDLSSKVPHPVFGDVKKYITTELVKQMYLNYECVSKDPRRYEITWGVRAKEEVDKKDLLKFACEVWGDTVPENWIIQHRDAVKSAKAV